MSEDAVTQYITASNGVRFAYRRFGTESEVPVVCHNHFRGNMDWWDPTLTNTIALTREVILFDNRGVGKTAGDVQESFQSWADDCIAFIEALGLDEVDLLGYSMGARVDQVQTVALTRPQLIRKMILAGASPVAPSPNSPKDTRDPKYMMAMANAVTYEESQAAFKLALFGESDAGSKSFEQYWQRLQQRRAEPPMLDPVPLDKGGKSQIAGILNADKLENVKWPDRLAELQMPVLVANGDNDLCLGLIRSLDLLNRIPNAQLVIYPNSGHGFLWQYGTLFGEQVNMFLDTNAFNNIV